MPFYQRDPFRELRTDRPWINPYMNLLGENRKEADLPILFGEELRDLKGNWREKIASLNGHEIKSKKLVLEVGCHFGRTLGDMAFANPETGFIGIDITFKRVVKSARRLKLKKVNNAVACLLDGRLLEMVLAPAELDGLVIFYPDPWTKRSQAKHRLLDEKTLRGWYELLGPGAFVWLKTDQESYFQETDSLLQSLGLEAQPHLSPLLGPDFTSSFESLFEKQKLGRYAQKYIKA